MKSLHSVLTLGAAALLLSACAGNWDPDAVKAMPSSGSAFQKGLQMEYADLGIMEKSEGDWTDASFFTGKAKAAAMGENVGPQELADRNIPKEAVGALTDARMRLVKALGGVNDGNAKDAARAQAMFDCWMQEQEENFQPADIEACRGEFEAALAKLGTPMQPVVLQSGPYMIYFPFNSAKLDAEGRAQMDRAIAKGKAFGPKEVMIIGHTDTSGDTAYNKKLSAARADTVAGALVDAGVFAKSSKGGLGEDMPAVSTGDGVEEKKNRRVSVTFKK